MLYTHDYTYAIFFFSRLHLVFYGSTDGTLTRGALGPRAVVAGFIFGSSSEISSVISML